MGLRRMADALTATAGSYARDNDIELVRAAAPSTLKLIEMLLDEQPHHAGLLSTACSGFTQYAFAFLQTDSEIAQASNPALASELRSRAALMYRRARGYCTRALDARYQGFGEEVLRDPAAATGRIDRTGVPALFWLGVSWGSEVAIADNMLLRLSELVAVRVILARALALDEIWEKGAIHEAMIVFDGLPALLGGSPARARRHFDRAVELSGGQSAFAYVTMASSVAVREKDRGAFEEYLKRALAIDVDREPSVRLANLVAQKRARHLLSRTAALFPAQ